MPFLIAISTFVTVTLMVYGLFHKSVAGGAMDVRLGGLRYSRPAKEALPDPEAAFSQRVLRPMLRTLSAKANGVLPSNMSERLEKALVQGGMKIKPGQLLLIVAFTTGVLPSLMTLYMYSVGQPFKMVAGTFGVMTALGVYGPRIMIMGRINRRKKEIWRSPARCLRPHHRLRRSWPRHRRRLHPCHRKSPRALRRRAHPHHARDPDGSFPPRRLPRHGRAHGRR